jgi:hypothetical protein
MPSWIDGKLSVCQGMATSSTLGSRMGPAPDYESFTLTGSLETAPPFTALALEAFMSLIGCFLVVSFFFPFFRALAMACLLCVLVCLAPGPGAGQL